MKVTAFILSLLAGIFSIFQSFLVGFAGAVGTGLAKVANDHKIKHEAGGMLGAAFLVFTAAILAFVGGAFALKGRTAGWVLLTISACLCFFAESISVFKDANIWGGVYAFSALLGFFSAGKKPTAARMQDAHPELSRIRGQAQAAAQPRQAQATVQPRQAKIPIPVAALKPAPAPLLPTPKLTVARGGNVVGEFTKPEIRQHITTGLLATSDWFWDTGANDWKSLSTLQ